MVSALLPKGRPMKGRMPAILARRALLLAIAQLAVLAEPSATLAREAWRLDDRLPERLSLSVTSRLRYEYLDEQFVKGTSGSEAAAVLRTLVHAKLGLSERLSIGVELQDSRAIYRNDTALSTSIVNTMEPLQGYLEFRQPELWGGSLSARFGLITMDIGDRRLVARNRFRNTINGFSGIDLRWQDSQDRELRVFWTLPVKRQPDTARRLRDGHVVFDRQSLDLQFWGAFSASDLPHLGRRELGRGELYFYGLQEDSTNDGPTRNRSLFTPGFRVLRAPADGKFDYQVEAALQIGRARASSSSTRTLNVFAQFYHAEAGYTFRVPWSPRVLLQYDYASGDDKPGNSSWQRFDTLFGARRFDFGPTGIYGPFARSNLNTPGIRVEVEPSSTVSSFVSYRGFWLASDKDAWTTANLQDPRGKSGSFVGSQLELRIRWKLLPGNLELEAGYAHLFAGEFIDDVPDGTLRGDTDYAYSQLTVSF